MNERAQSESIGVILLVGVVVISVATVGAFALSNMYVFTPRTISPLSRKLLLTQQ